MLKVWSIRVTSGVRTLETEVLQTIPIKPKYIPLAASCAQLDYSSSVLAVAGTRSTIQIFISEGEQYSLVATLTGHEGWIRSLAFTHESSAGHGDVLLASASQDKYIRLWRIHRGSELPAASSAANDQALGAFGKALSNKAHRFHCGEKDYSVTFEALLLGHEDWIYSASWKRTEKGLCLLSASADNSLSVWEADPSSGVWLCTARLGEISVQKGSSTATGSTGGFWIGLWSPDGNAVASLGRTGSWRLWQRGEHEERCTQRHAVSGHIKDVKGVAWAPDGSYLLSTGSDQTTRLFAEWKRNDKLSWHEFSRAQIHGYDLNCIDTLSAERFISGADEKLLRVFDEPAAVADILDELCGITTDLKHSLPDAANLPVLGLSNKAVQAIDADDAEVLPQNSATNEQGDLAPVPKIKLEMDQPPLEDHLARHMLWPEAEKLYGHGYEISAVSASHDGNLVATACRASSIDHAVIRVYETREWREVKPPLTAHSLTVTGLRFSPDDQYLLSVGRDRQWAVFKRDGDNSNTYETFASNPKGHSRMILGGGWAPHDVGRMFATAGRDKSVKIWKLESGEGTCVTTFTADSPVTAVDFLPKVHQGVITLAYGTEAGLVGLCRIDADGSLIGRAAIDGQSMGPLRAVTQLSWRPNVQGNAASDGIGDGVESSGRQLAVASDDSSVRIYSVNISTIG